MPDRSAFEKICKWWGIEPPAPMSREAHLRAVGLSLGLDSLFGSCREAEMEWMQLPREDLGNRSPLQVVQERDEHGIAHTQSVLDRMRNLY